MQAGKGEGAINVRRLISHSVCRMEVERFDPGPIPVDGILVRTAYCGAHNYHDSNYITFHRLLRFRPLLTRIR